MGLIKAALGSAGGVLADQWKEYFYCESLPENVMAVKGQKRTSGRSSHTKGSDNIISNGRGRRPVHDDRGSGPHRGGLRRARRVYLRYVHRTLSVYR